MERETPDILWSGSEDAESLHCRTPEEAAIEFMEESEEDLRASNAIVTVHQYKRQEIDKKSFIEEIENDIEIYFNDNYGGEEFCDLDVRVKEAIEKVVDTVIDTMPVTCMYRTCLNIEKPAREWLEQANK
jgi:hypothetical protein